MGEGRCGEPLDALAAALAGRSHRTLPTEGKRAAAVLVALVPRGGEWHILLTKRTDTVEHHKGQISFPGGMIDPGDADPVATALRETEEEVGIPSSQVRVLGRLDDFYTAVTPFHVTPIVGTIEGEFTPAPNPQETAEVLLASMRELLDPARWRQETWMGVPVSFYDVAGVTVWGATARILDQFLDIWRSLPESLHG